MKLRRWSLLSLLPLAVAAGADSAPAMPPRAAGGILPLADILERARKAQPGKVLETELERERGRHVYDVVIRDAAGRVWELEFDARSGELLRHGPND